MTSLRRLRALPCPVPRGLAVLAPACRLAVGLAALGLAAPIPAAPIPAATSRAQDPELPRTVPESSDHRRTSSLSDVEGFLEQLEALPGGARLRRWALGASGEGRPIWAVGVGLSEAWGPARLPSLERPDVDPDAALPDDGRVRAVVVANIHAGEVEGKEAVQAFLREVVEGRHAGLLEGLQLVVLPVYNADGNERVDARHRVEQNGPGAVGSRENAAGLDLNRDFVKVEAPETRALMALVRAFDPHLLVDLHTTDGSYHGYHLTYATSLSPNVDRDLDAFARGVLLEGARRRVLAREGLRVFDYGNLSRDGARWSTYDSRPRFGTNAFGLRNRVSVLSEAYSYLPFAERIAATHAFLLAVLEGAAREGDELRARCAAADARCASGAPLLFGHGARLRAPRPATVLLGEVREVPVPGGGVRREALPVWSEHTLGVQDAFVAPTWSVLPHAWAVPEPEPALLEALAVHGVRFGLLAEASEGPTRAFEPERVRRAERPFQGHHELRLSGRWGAGPGTLPAGTLVVPAAQPLARLAAHLLEPESDDSLSTWNGFEARTRARDGDTPGTYPVLRIEAPRAWTLVPPAPR